jgi:lysophospholipase L1-like esterase
MMPPATNDANASGAWSSFVSRALAVLLGMLLACSIAEVALHAYAHWGGVQGRRLASRDPLGAIYGPYGNAGYRPVPGKVEHFPNGTSAHYNSMAYRGPLVSIPKPRGVYRIILLGGSTTVGYGVNDDQTIDAYMRALLREQHPGGCFEVVNLGLGGYDSYQDYERMRVDGTKLTPDLVIVHSGINDVRNAQFANLRSPPDPRTLIWDGPMKLMREVEETGPSPWVLAKHYFYLPRLPGFVWELWRQRQTLHTITVGEPHDDAIRYFETNVTRTVEVGLKAGAAVLLSKPPSALPLRDRPSAPVERSYWIRDAGTTEAYRERLGAAMARIAEIYGGAGSRVSYVTHQLPLAAYLDDAHLNAAGNAVVARDLITAATPYLPRSGPSAYRPGCAP